ncbi:MAG: hypothetical protein KTR25_19370 [Myxococcales bacterium]|nr:hypothetical protein [Myxococcales bacterium]
MRSTYGDRIIPVWALLVGALALSSCETDDPRERVPAGDTPATEGAGNDLSERGLGEACDPNPDAEESDIPDCQAGLGCFEGVCTPETYITACTPNPCGEDNVCNARSEVDANGLPTGENLIVICRCAPGLEWDGTTCLASEAPEGFPEFSGSVLGFEEDGTAQTCPGPEGQPGVPGATDCPEDSFCDAASSGRCLEYNFSMVGTINGADVDIATTGLEQTTIECIQEYLEADSTTSEGVKLVIAGDLAGQISTGANTVTIDVSNNDVLSGNQALILPQVDAPPLRSDSGIVDVIIEGDTVSSLAALGGQFTIDSVSDGNATDDDNGAIGGTFFIGLPDAEFLAASFVIPCGANEIVSPEGE